MRTLLRSTLACALLLPALAPRPAAAMGFGTSYGLGLGAGPFGGPVTGFLPSFDLRTDAFILQTYPLDLLVFAAADELVLGGDLYFPVVSQDGPGGFRKVIQPGVSADIVFDGGAFTAMGVGRLGVEAKSGLGVYIVPGIGFTADGGVDLAAQGRLEMSVWFD
jgi:hypothetical protein